MMFTVALFTIQKLKKDFFLMFDIWGMGHPYDINIWAKHNEDSFIFMM